MNQIRSSLALALSLSLVFVASDQAQPSESTGRDPRMLGASNDLLGLLRLEQVQNELKLSDGQTAKVKEIRDRLHAEMHAQYSGLREMDDEQRRAKISELREQRDAKAREQLREVLPREQLIRLYQIRLHMAGPVYGLNNEYVANRLKLTPEQKKKAAAIDKETQKKTYELFRGLYRLSQEERSEKFRGIHDKYGKIRSDANKQAFGLLTAEQKEAFENLKGEKFQLQMPPKRS